MKKVACLRSKIQRNISIALAKLLTPYFHFDNAHVDIDGPLPPYHGQTFVGSARDFVTDMEPVPNDFVKRPLVRVEYPACDSALRRNVAPRKLNGIRNYLASV
ncbi:hypothetical protein MRX96_027161 [Rhipicephalus microplus]